MSYNLYISRKEYWGNEDGEDIKKEEFDECIKNENIEKVSDDEYIWKSAFGDQREEPSFWYEEEFGSITAKNPEPETIKLMCILAKKLKAEVQGEDGEIYDENAESKHRE